MIKEITFHILVKEKYNQGKITINPEKIIPEQGHHKFLSTLNNAYAGRAGKGFGVFDPDKDSFPMQNLLEDYLLESNFDSLTQRMMNILLSTINSESSATGGKVFITHYEDQDNEYILIAILSEKVGFLTNDWNVTEKEILDIEHLKFAGRINLSAWQAKETRYISFLKGKSNVSKYFKKFLGCNDAVFAKTETENLVNLLFEFSNEQKLDIDTKAEFFTKAKEYLSCINNKDESFSLETFSNAVWPESPQILINKLGNLDNGISDGFIPDKNAMKKLTTYTGKTKNWRLSFDRTAVSEGLIEEEGGRIIINKPTDELLRAFGK